MKKKRGIVLISSLLSFLLLAVIGAIGIYLINDRGSDAPALETKVSETIGTSQASHALTTEESSDPTQASFSETTEEENSTDSVELPHEREGIWIAYDHRLPETSKDSALRKTLLFASEMQELLPLRMYQEEIGRLTFYNDTDHEAILWFYIHGNSVVEYFGQNMMEITKEATVAPTIEEEITPEIAIAITLPAKSQKEVELYSDSNQTVSYAFAYHTQNQSYVFVSNDEQLQYMNTKLKEITSEVTLYVTGKLAAYDEKNLYSLPACDVIWPQNEDYEQMAMISNVKSVNGVFLRDVYQVGGKENLCFSSLQIKASQNSWTSQDLIFEQQYNKYILKIPYSIPDSSLLHAELFYQADGNVEFWGEGKNSDGSFNLLKPWYCKITDPNGETHVYRMECTRDKHAIPVVYITTDNGSMVTSKTRYITGTFRMDADHVEGIDSIDLQTIQIKGRGHSTWKKEKKPFALKFSEKVSIMGLSKNKDWVMLANYFDPSLSRNYVAYEMAKELDFDFTPSSYPVDVFYNGTYIGVYGIGEKIEIANNRVNLEPADDSIDRDYLIEIGGYGSGSFTIGSMQGISIDYPKPEELSKEQRNYVIQYLKTVNDAIVNGKNYEDYIDMDSLIDWFIMTELTYNCDSSFLRSVYMIKRAGGKLEFQPVWDYDLSMGNLATWTPEYTSWATSQNGFIEITWGTYLIQDPHFRDLLQKRWEQVRDRLLERGLLACQTMRDWMVAGSGAENFSLWVTPGEKIGWEWEFMYNYTSTEQHIDYLSSFLKMRTAYLDRIIIDREPADTYVKPQEKPTEEETETSEPVESEEKTESKEQEETKQEAEASLEQTMMQDEEAM